MKTYTAHLRASRPPLLVKEAFSWGAFLFGPLWLLAQRAWIAAVMSAVVLALTLMAPPPARPVLSFAVLLTLGIFGRDLMRWTLSRRGYALAHVVAGRNSDDAFLRLLDHVPDLLPSRGAGA